MPYNNERGKVEKKFIGIPDGTSSTRKVSQGQQLWNIPNGPTLFGPSLFCMKEHYFPLGIYEEKSYLRHRTTGSCTYDEKFNCHGPLRATWSFSGLCRPLCK
jgi:hypothetical protein